MGCVKGGRETLLSCKVVLGLFFRIEYFKPKSAILTGKQGILAD
jgi:hypothetical protein